MNTIWRTFRTSTWLGWEMDANWTEPWLFAIYSIVKPVAGAFILILMYFVFAVVFQTQDPALFSYMYVGNAFFIFVASALFGTFQVIQSDREWFQTIRYVYISPISYYVYMMGRAVSKILISTFAVIVTLAFGVAFLGVQIELALGALPIFLAGLILGLFSLLTIGVSMGGVSFLTARHTGGIAESVPGIFYVFCGVLYPLAFLPAWAQSVGLAIPLTYWFEIIRRTLVPSAAPDPTLAGFSDLTIMAILFFSSLIFFGLSLGVIKMGDYFARKAGKIDMTTSY